MVAVVFDKYIIRRVRFGINCTILYQSKPSNFAQCLIRTNLLLLFIATLEAVMREDLLLCVQLLAHCSPEDPSEDREGCTALHITCSLGNIIITQLLVWASFKFRV